VDTARFPSNVKKERGGHKESSRPTKETDGLNAPFAFGMSPPPVCAAVDCTSLTCTDEIDRPTPGASRSAAALALQPLKSGSRITDPVCIGDPGYCVRGVSSAGRIWSTTFTNSSNGSAGRVQT
jgi:hypothetical protein